MRTVLKYPGSKWNIVSKLVELIPEHHSYVEPFFGSGAVLFNKPVSDIETINDLDHDVVNLFRCIQEDADRLSGMVMTTPFSREKYEDTYKLDVWKLMMPDEPYHKALRFLIQCWQGHGFRTNGSKVGWKNDVQGRDKAYAANDWAELPGRLLQAAERLRGVQIENMPAVKLIERFNFSNVLIYCDPPYLLQTRTGGKQYKKEMSVEEHIQLLETIKQHSGPAIISGYDNELYNTMLNGWYTEKHKSLTQGNSKKQEMLWMNFGSLENQQLNIWS